MIRRHKTTIFTDAKESTTVYELKRIVEGILKRAPEDQRLFKVTLTFFLMLCVHHPPSESVFIRNHQLREMMLIIQVSIFLP